MFGEGFILLGIAIITVVTSCILTWKKKITNKVCFLVPTLIIASILAILTQKILWDVDNISRHAAEEKSVLIENKWQEIERQLKGLQEENFSLASHMAGEVISGLKDIPAEDLDAYLETLQLRNASNPITQATEKALRSVYFRNIHNNDNDPFALLLGRNLEESFIYTNFSTSYTLPPGSAFSLKDDYDIARKLTSGNPVGITQAIDKIIQLEPGHPLSATIFYQNNPRNIALDNWSLSCLKNLFTQMDGDTYQTFESLIFIAPHYIYRNEAISGTPRIIDRSITDAKILGVVSTFNYLDVLETDITLKARLQTYDQLLKEAQYRYVLEERSTLVVGILMMVVILVLLILFGTFMHSVVKRRPQLP
jgi:hypothetical protein